MTATGRPTRDPDHRPGRDDPPSDHGRGLPTWGVAVLLVGFTMAWVALPGGLVHTVWVWRTSALIVVLLSPVLVLALVHTAWRHRRLAQWRRLPAVLLLLLAVIAAYRLVLTAPRLWESEWNWQGHGSALLLTLAVVLVWRRVSVRSVGLTRWARPGARRAVVWTLAVWVGIVLLVTALDAAAGGAVGTDRDPVEAVLWQATMPGLVEELFYRGLLLVALDRVLGRPWWVLGARVGWGLVLTSVLFGIAHLDSGPGVLVWTTISGLVFGWLRNRTDSVWPSVALHNLHNLTILAVLLLLGMY